MRKVLVLGAGHSAPFLIRYLLDHATALEAEITVADRNGDAARAAVDDHPCGQGIDFNLFDAAASKREIAAADVVVSLLPPSLQATVARHCLEGGSHMVSASYRSPEMLALDGKAQELGLTLLCELGLDPGIDVMSAQLIIDRIHADGGEIRSFCSYGGGLPEPDFSANPLRYCVTWNPRNVVMAAEHGAEYLRGGQTKAVPWHRVFENPWEVEIPGLGMMDAYPNRDSLSYREVHGLSQVETIIRATLRYPGYCRFWNQMVRLGLPNEHLSLPDLSQRSLAELLTIFLPENHSNNADLRQRTAQFLGQEADAPEIDKLAWLGFFEDTPIGDLAGDSPRDALVALLERKLPLPAQSRDMVVLHHDFEVHYPKAKRSEQIHSTLIHFGDAGGVTAMARGVGFPAALGVEMLLKGELDQSGVLVPVGENIYRPILKALEQHGIHFDESTTPLPPTPK